MKSILTNAIVFAVILLIASCTKTETTPSAAETNGTLLAGAKGASKSWSLVSITQSVNGGTAQSATGIPACETDNIFQFFNNTSQSYTQTEGATVCTTGDPATLETGSWALTDDGKSLLIDASVNVTSTQVNSEQFLIYYILSQGEPLTVSQLTATSLTLTYTVIDTSVSPSNTYLITIGFTKI